MTIKKYKFNFYGCTTFNSNINEAKRSVFEIINAMLLKFNCGDSSVKTIGSYNYELRFIELTNYGFKGIIGKHRNIDLPHVAIIGGNEREIDLEDNENLLEKTHFSYHSDFSIIILQHNYLCINYHNLSKYLTDNNNVISLNPIIEPESLEWLLNNHVQIRTAEFKIARPTNPELFNGIHHDFNNSIISTLKGSGSATINLTIRGNARSDIAEERYLAGTIKGAIRELLTTFDVKKCKFLLENDETNIANPVDLVSELLSYIKEIDVNGRYPSSLDVWSALDEAKNEKQKELEKYFGESDRERLA